MILNVNNRLSAFIVHLCLSIALLVVLLYIIFYHWFPYELIHAGGVDGLKILISVDLVLGPLLTFIVFKKGKKGLKTDLFLIGTIQVCCLAAGLWLIYNERPLAQVLADDGVHLLAASDFKYYKVDLIDLPGSYPKNVLLDLPEDRATVSSVKFASEFVDEKPFSFRSDLYLPMNDVNDDKYQKRIRFINSVEPEQKLTSKDYDADQNCYWVPLFSKHYFGNACINQSKGIVRLRENNN